MLTLLYQLPVEKYQFENINILLSTICVLLLSGIVYLYKENKKLISEHKNDLKLFDGENKKLTNELFDILNRFHLSIEEGKLLDKDAKEKLDKIITLLESLRNN